MSDSGLLQKEDAIYQANRDWLESRYLGCFVVIHGNAVLGMFEDVGSAARWYFPNTATSRS